MMIRFDFEGALNMARHLVATEGQVLSIDRKRAGARRSALDQEHFIGPEADIANERAEREDELVKTVVPRLDAAAHAWAAEWANLINEKNQEEYEWRAEIIQRENRSKQESYFRHKRSNPDSKRSYPKMGSIEPPAGVEVPLRINNFEPTEPPFVGYSRVGLDYKASYRW